MKPLNSLAKSLRHFISKYITKTKQTPKISETREKNPPEVVIPKPKNPSLISAQSLLLKPTEDDNLTSAPPIEHSPYCKGKYIVKRSLRKKKYETVQLYLCNQCQKTFTPYKVKGKSFPLSIVLEGLGSMTLNVPGLMSTLILSFSLYMWCIN